jgi:hypothetical protein
MKIKIKDENGQEIEVQVCRNKYGTVYFRRVPYTAKDPTPKQREVRDLFALASSQAFNSTREEVIENIKQMYAGWVKEGKTEAEITELIKRLYPKDYEIIVQFLKMVF